VANSVRQKISELEDRSFEIDCKTKNNFKKMNKPYRA
jgi:hypothetical protein